MEQLRARVVVAHRVLAKANVFVVCQRAQDLVSRLSQRLRVLDREGRRGSTARVDLLVR